MRGPAGVQWLGLGDSPAVRASPFDYAAKFATSAPTSHQPCNTSRLIAHREATGNE